MGAAVAVPDMGLSAPVGGDSWDDIHAFLNEPDPAQPGVRVETVDGEYREVPGETQPMREKLPAPVKQQWANLDVGMNRMNRRAQRIKTPGGIAAMLFAVGFFLFAIVPVNGKRTRLILLWDTLTMRATLPTPGEQSPTSTAVANASAIAQAATAGASVAVHSAFPGIGNGAFQQTTSVPGTPYVPYSPIGYGG